MVVRGGATVAMDNHRMMRCVLRPNGVRKQHTPHHPGELGCCSARAGLSVFCYRELGNVLLAGDGIRVNALSGVKLIEVTTDYQFRARIPDSEVIGSVSKGKLWWVLCTRWMQCAPTALPGHLTPAR